MVVKLTTHVLDTAAGQPAAGLVLRLYRREADGRVFEKADRTNEDGRTDSPLFAREIDLPVRFELWFEAGDYLRSAHPGLITTPPFLDRIPIHFTIAEARHFHVPLLLSPYGYSTYRGS